MRPVWLYLPQCIAIMGATGLSFLLTAVHAAESVEPGVVYLLEGTEIADEYGVGIEVVGDIDGDGDGDGAPDFAVAANENRVIDRENSTRPPGYCLVHSGRTGKVLRRFVGWHENQDLGWDLTSIADFTGDGIRELVFRGADKIVFWDPAKDEILFNSVPMGEWRCQHGACWRP